MFLGESKRDRERRLTDAWRQIGAYAGRILKGAKPCRSSGRAHAARVLDLTVPPALLSTADEVIE